MKIGIFSSAFTYLNDTELAFRRMHQLGYRYVDQDLSDITADYYQDTAVMEAHCRRIREAAAAENIIIHQVHGPWPTDDTTPESRKEVWDYMHRAVYGCHLLGCRYLVIHPQMPFGWGAEEDADFAEELTIGLIRELMPDCEKYGVILCLENMPMQAHRISPMKKIVETVSKIRSNHIGICLDTGHCNVYGHDLGEMVRCAAPYLKVLHIHDNSGQRDEHLLPYFGTADWDSFTSALAEIGYEGPIMLETSGYIPENAPEEILAKAEELTVSAARMLAGMVERKL